MKYFNNLLQIYFRRFLKTINKGYRYYKQNPDFNAIMKANFTEHQKFVFIQIGANDGISFDVLFDIVRKRDSEGIVVEPVKEYFEQLKHHYSNYPKIKKINKAVHPTKRSVTLYKVSNKALHKYPSWAKGIASLDASHHLKTNIDTKDIVTEKVTCDTLMNIINDYKNQPIDLLQIDTEGFDYEVIKMIDFNEVKPKIIKYESINLTILEKEKSVKLLKNNDYTTFTIGIDTLAINLKKVKLHWK